MTRRSFVLVAGIAMAILVWAFARTHPTAGAAQEPIPGNATYGANSDEVARHRWEAGAARHWRHLVTKR